MQAPMVAAVWKHLAGKEKKNEKDEKEVKREKKKDPLLYPGRAPWEVHHNSHLYLFKILYQFWMKCFYLKIWNRKSVRF